MENKHPHIYIPNELKDDEDAIELVKELLKPTETEILKQRLQATEDALLFLMDMNMIGGM